MPVQTGPETPVTVLASWHPLSLGRMERKGTQLVMDLEQTLLLQHSNSHRVQIAVGDSAVSLMAVE